METNIAFNVEHVLWVISGPGETTSSTIGKSCPENSRKRANAGARVAGSRAESVMPRMPQSLHRWRNRETGKPVGQCSVWYLGYFAFTMDVIWHYQNPMQGSLLTQPVACSSLANYSVPSLDGCLEIVLETLGTKTPTSYHVCFTGYWWPCAVDMSLEKMPVLIDNVHSEDHIFLHVFWTCAFQWRGGDSKKDR